MAVPLSGKSWADLKPALSQIGLDGLNRLGFTSMTPVQSATIPLFMTNKDVAVEAVTGSGKTLAFVIPIMEMLNGQEKHWTKNQVGSLVVTPTRELATQIAGVFESFLPSQLTQYLLIGGRDLQTDIDFINNQGAQVIVATPGRLLNLLERVDSNLASAMRSLEVLVLDEADRLLELGFEKSINTIISYLPKQRRTGLFSATLTQDVKALIRAGMRNPVTITVRDKQSATDLTPTPQSLCNYYLICSPLAKFSKLLSFINMFSDKKIIVFFATCACVSYFSVLTRRLCPSLKILALHGKMKSRRQKLFSEFSELSSGVLLCTDVLARGVDFPAVDWVVQFDPPSSVKAFVHRCGRTARMGNVGNALVMLLPTERNYVEFLALNQHIVLEEYSDELEVTDELLSAGRELASKEREIFEKGKRAFVSFVHFYYKHECRLIFQAKELDLVSLAQGFALPHLPKMPELKGRDVSVFTPHSRPQSQIPYKDKKREKQRKAKMKQQAESVLTRKSKEKGKKSHSEGKIIKQRKRKRKSEHGLSEGDLEELAREARLLKKFKAGKITKEEMETALDEF